jgi:hypothetical protein
VQLRRSDPAGLGEQGAAMRVRQAGLRRGRLSEASTGRSICDRVSSHFPSQSLHSLAVSDIDEHTFRIGRPCIPNWTRLVSGLDIRKELFSGIRFLTDDHNVDSLFPRGASARVAIAMTDTPVVLANGPRQCGKTPLVRALFRGERPYFTLDDDTTLASAKN